MGLVPFAKKRVPAGYAGASGPRSAGRMPEQMSTPSIEGDSGPDATATIDAPPVDGGLRGHDTNYPRPGKVEPFGKSAV